MAFGGGAGKAVSYNGQKGKGGEAEGQTCTPLSLSLAGGVASIVNDSMYASSHCQVCTHLAHIDMPLFLIFRKDGHLGT